MMRKKLLLSLGLACCLAVVARADDKSKVDLDKMVGKWSFTSGTKFGEAIDKQRLAAKVTVTKDKTFELPGQEGGQGFVMNFKIDDKESPAKIDMSIKSGPVAEGKAIGIIELKDDELKLCYVPEGGERPKKFESTKDNGAFFFILKRDKAPK